LMLSSMARVRWEYEEKMFASRGVDRREIRWRGNKGDTDLAMPRIECIWRGFTTKYDIS
jgi:hypothetical protein